MLSLLSAVLLFLLASGSTLAQEPESSSQDDAPEEDEGEVIVVTSSRSETPLSESVVKVEVVTHEIIEASGALDAAEALSSAPGVQITRSFRGAGVRMLGLDSQYVLVLVDGQRVLGNLDGVIDLTRFPTHRVEQIEVVKGTSSVIYGSEAIAGVINIIRSRPESAFENDTSVQYGSHNTLDANTSFGTRRDDWSFVASTSYYQSDGFDWYPPTPQTDWPDTQRFNADATAWGRLGPAVSLTADIAYMYRDTAQIYDSAEDHMWASMSEEERDTVAIYDERNLTEDVEGRLRADILPDASSSLKITGSGGHFRDQYASDQRGSDDLDDYQDTRDTQAQLVAQYDRVMGRHFASLGMEGQFEYMERERLTQVGQRYRMASYLQDEWTLGRAERLVLSPGARIDVDSKFGFQPTPRLAVRYDPTEMLALRAVVGQGYKAPTFQQMYLEFANAAAGYVIRGNEDLQPETSFNLYGGVELAPLPELRLSLDVFRVNLTNQITYAAVDEETGDYTFDNVASSYTEGVELGAEVHAWDLLTALVGYAFNYGFDEEAGDIMSMNTLHRVTATLIADHEPSGLTATLRGELSGPTRFYNYDADLQQDVPYDHPLYTNMDLRLGKHFLRDRLQAYAGVNNLLNQGDSEYIRLVPRTWYGGLTFRHPPQAASSASAAVPTSQREPCLVSILPS